MPALLLVVARTLLVLPWGTRRRVPHCPGVTAAVLCSIGWRRVHGALGRGRGRGAGARCPGKAWWNHDLAAKGALKPTTRQGGKQALFYVMDIGAAAGEGAPRPGGAGLRGDEPSRSVQDHPAQVRLGVHLAAADAGALGGGGDTAVPPLGPQAGRGRGSRADSLILQAGLLASGRILARCCARRRLSHQVCFPRF